MNKIIDQIKDAFRKSNNIVVQLIIINVISFVLFAFLKVLLTIFDKQLILKEINNHLFLSSHLNYFLSKAWTLFTHIFMETNIFSVLVNMLLLYWFGNLIAQYLGHKKVLYLYVFGGIAGGVLFLLSYNLIPFFVAKSNTINSSIPLFGANSSVYALMIACVTYMPNYEMRFFFVGRIKLIWLVVLYLFISFINIISPQGQGHLSQLGGALFGYLYIKQSRLGNDFAYKIKNIFKRKPKLKVTKNTKSKHSKVDLNDEKLDVESKQKIIDDILDKISESGYESLSKEEKQLLFQASKK